MGSVKGLLQNFSDFRGLDVRSSDLSRPLNAAKEVKNFILEKNFSLSGEQGVHLWAAQENGYPIIATHSYRYKDLDTGVEQEELIAIGHPKTASGSGLFRLREDGSLNITYAGAATWQYSFLPQTANTFQLNRREVAGPSVSLNGIVGLERSNETSWDLAFAATTLTSGDFTVTVTGDDSIPIGVLPISYETALAPGTVNIPFSYWEEIPLGLAIQDVTGPFVGAVYNHTKIDQILPTFVNKNNVCYIATGGRAPLLKYDGVCVRQAGMFGLLDDDIILTAAASGTALVGTFRYYLRFATKDAQGNFIYGSGALTDPITTTAGQAPYLEILDSSLGWDVITPGFLLDFAGDSTSVGATNTFVATTWPDESILISRGLGELKAGDLVYITGTSGPQVRQVVSVDRSTSSIVFDGPPITFNAAETLQWANAIYTGDARALTNALQTNVSTITYTGMIGVVAGMWLFFSEEQEWYQVLEVDTGSSTITINGIVSIPAGLYDISSVVLEVWRTEDSGTEKFYLSQQITRYTALAAAFAETTADTALGAELLRPTKEPDALLTPPGVVTQHQNVMIAAGGYLRSGRLHFEDFEYLEAFPAAENFHDLPSGDAGIITALWSDSYDQLAVFKDSSYISVVGSFRDDIPLLVTVANTENDVGISSQNSLLKIRGLNIGIGPVGFVAFKDGNVDYELTKQLDAEFLAGFLEEDVKPRFSKAISVNDKQKQQAYFLIPAFETTDGVTHTGANNNSKIFILDYSESSWGRRSFPDDLYDAGSGVAKLVSYPFLPTAGMVIHNDRLIITSCAYDSTVSGTGYLDFVSYSFRRKDRDYLGSNPTNYRYDYLDQSFPIEYDYKSGWFYGDSPFTDKLFHWLKIYSFPNTDFVPFDLRVRTYLDWDDTTAIDDVTLSFDTTTFTQTYKLLATRGTALMVRFTVDTKLEKPTITGFEIITGEVDSDIEGVR